MGLETMRSDNEHCFQVCGVKKSLLFYFFGHYGEEMAYDHPAIVLKNFRNGLIVAPITSNQNLYKNPKEFHILLPANDAKRGKMLKNSTIKLEQLRYISKKRILISGRNKRRICSSRL